MPALRGERADAVRSFLLAFKSAVTGGGVYLVPRHDTLSTLEYLGLIKRNLAEILLGLSVADYTSGPEADRDQPGELWVFGKRVKGEEIYIKLKLVEVGEQRLAKCLSFHIARGPLRHPIQDENDGGSGS